MKEIALLILGVIFIYVYSCTFLFWYWAFKGKHEIIRSDKKRYYCLFIGSLIGIGLFFYVGFERALFFIPADWGGVDEDGDFVSTRRYLAGLLSMYLTVFIHARPHQLVKFFKSREE